MRHVDGLKLLAQGSAKDLYTHPNHPDHLFVDFSDRVSVFDFGALPENIDGRGAALKRVALAFEEIFRHSGIRTSFDQELSRKYDAFVMRKATATKFSSQESQSSLRFIPLEVIFRWGVPAGSSLLKRDNSLKAFQIFEKPLIEFSTKFESSDRIVDRHEAVQLAGDVKRLEALEALAIKCAHTVKDACQSLGLELWDGKIECAWDSIAREVILVDAFTPDEMRMSFPGMRDVPLSKELLRRWLGATVWAAEMATAKKQFGDKWKASVPLPPKLGKWRTQVLLSLYESLAASFEKKSSHALLNFLRGSDLAKPKVFVSGSGGREAALKWRLSIEGCEIVESADLADTVWITQDALLEAGEVDAHLKNRQWVSGATRDAAKIEWSKIFGRQVAADAGIAIPRYSVDPNELRSFLRPPVVKFDGLAAGKGVVVPKTFDEAALALKEWSSKGNVLLEERLEGFEASAFFYIRPGNASESAIYLGCAQDFKRRYPGDEGPNTGGMGALAPHPKIQEADIELFKSWAQATIQVLENKGSLYEGFLYLGLMKDAEKGWHLIEYNARPGDPETQALVMQWPEERPVLRGLLSLSVRSVEARVATEGAVLCLALVRPEYPEPAPKAFDLPAWNLNSEAATAEIQLFKNSSHAGRVAYLVARGETHRVAADKIFETLIHSPWKELLEWRADLLP